MIELPSQAWSVSTCARIQQRNELARFWLSAPDDLLPSLWSSPLGQATKDLVKQLDANSTFTSEQVQLRDEIGKRLQNGFTVPNGIQMLLSAWLFSPPGLMRIENPEALLPEWLIQDYKEMYDSSHLNKTTTNSPYISSNTSQSQDLTSSIDNQPATALPSPEFGEFPSNLTDLVNNRVQLNRMLGLANLYYIDPEDLEIREELKKLRLDFASSIQSCPEDQLESLWATDLGDRFWAIVRSGIQKEQLTETEESLKQGSTSKLQSSNGGGFGTPGAINAFLIAMLFYEPGKMRVDSAEQKLPSWLLNSYQQIFAETASTGS